MSLNVFQKISIKSESFFLDSDADFSSGVKVRPLDRVKLEGITQSLIENPTVREDWDDVGGAPVAGMQEAKLDLAMLLSGATVTSGQASSDALTDILTWIVGASHIVTNGTVGDGSNTSTADTIYSNDTFAAGDIVMISGEVRRISAVSGTAYTLDIPLSAAPADGTDIIGLEYQEITPSGAKSIAMGLETEDTEMRYFLQGTIPAGGVGIELKSGDFARLALSLESAKWTRGTAITHATTGTPDTGVQVGDGGQVAIKGASGNLVTFCPSDLTVSLGLGYEWIPCTVGTNGKAGYEPVPADSTMEITAYQDGVLSTLEGLVESTFPLVVQIGDEQGKVVGIYYPEATISVYPTGTEIGAVLGVKVGFKTSSGILFRG